MTRVLAMTVTVLVLLRDIDRVLNGHVGDISTRW